MRPPRAAILVLFCSASFFLVCRSISSIRRPSPSATSLPPRKSPFRALFSFGAPFSLFPPSAAISLTDDNSTFFPARPAAFGPPLPAKGLSGRLWIGSGFPEETLQDGEGEGELGCSDLPEWEDGRLKLAITATEQASASSKSGPAAISPKSLGSDDLAKDPAAGRNGVQKRQPKPRARSVDDGTDDHLLESLRKTRSPSSEASTASGASHADIQSIQETAEITGKVVLLSRGGCGFVDKVKWAQRRGAVAVIVGDNQKGGPLIQMFARDNADNVTIPSVFTSRTTAHLLSSLMQPGSLVEDVLGRIGDPPLKAQRSSKTGGNKNAQRSSTSAKYDRNLASKSLPGQPKEPTAARRSSISRRFGWRGGQGVSPKDSATEKSFSSSSETSARQAAKPGKAGNSQPVSSNGPNGGSITRESGEYVPDPVSASSGKSGSSSGPRRGFFGKVFGDKEEAGGQFSEPSQETGSPSVAVPTPAPLGPGGSDARDGLWVTITPTGSASPFFDTLLVLVVSPLITLTVVYALLILRIKIRMRRWRAPKSVVDRLPVRTYQTVASSPTQSPRTASPTSSSPTTPLLSRPRSHTTTGVPGRALARTDDAVQVRVHSHEKNSRSVSSEWKKYMGRQVECVVCLEEYVDGVSRVMSLPCGHEFHAECITPWLTTRRRTCPICKNDVVRSLARGTSSGPQYEPFREDGYENNGEASDTFENRLPSPNRLDDDLERGPGWSQPSRQDWHASRHDVWFSALTSRIGGSSSFSTRRDASGEDRGR
ncbi:hypothetical protein N657DRAFT_593985 [Parathielavia appendiculata]|uniref:RING-type E3 ubiquitin transferase n=1 Tax=Parathielavia appendiculata TaxID=2587402 RepID=A0AAN6U266_9PEZI|nr:hypothetical protein N657DRAFT_593985 [Parathielavia appendiculata]